MSRFGGLVAGASAPSVSALPTAAAGFRGQLLVVPGNGTTTADQLYTCLRSATGTWSWKSVSTG